MADSDFVPIRIAVLTVSDTRTFDDDRSGSLLADRLIRAGHNLAARQIVRDEIIAIRSLLSEWIADPSIDAILTTGGTGLTGRDVTPEAIAPLITKPIDGFAFLFHLLSYELIGTSTIQSRAFAGLAETTFIFALPGSPGACRDAWDKILVYQFDKRQKPCNFVEIMPRLSEGQ